MRHPVYCRICGNENNLRYCSQCGLLLDHPTENILKILLCRIEFIIQPIFQFLVTWFLLFFVPKTFFESLTTDGEAVNASLIVRRKNKPSTFSPWLRPMTPAGYFVFGGFLFNIASEYFDVFNSVVNELFPSNFKSNASPIPFVINILHALAIEAIFFIILISMISFYKAILGIGKHRLGDFVEYYLYIVIQYWICSIAFLITAILLQEKDILVNGFIFFACCMLVLSMYYFLYVPWRFLSLRFCIGFLRLVGFCAFVLFWQTSLFFISTLISFWLFFPVLIF